MKTEQLINALKNHIYETHQKGFPVKQFRTSVPVIPKDDDRYPNKTPPLMVEIGEFNPLYKTLERSYDSEVFACSMEELRTAVEKYLESGEKLSYLGHLSS